MKKVDELVAEWSEEEREQLKDLIEECREREKDIIENSGRSRENLIKLTDSLTSLFSNSWEIKAKFNIMGDILLGIYLQLHKNKMAVA